MSLKASSGFLRTLPPPALATCSNKDRFSLSNSYSCEYGTTIPVLNVPVVIDADALNILSKRDDLLLHLAKNSIFTPHLKEFDCLFGVHKSWWDRLQTARRMAKKLGSVIVLKNQYTFIIDQQGDVMINPTGNPAMSQGGMGDVLTGLITAYVAQGYSAKAAAILGCYFHGRAGDELALSHHNITASQLAAQIPVTVKSFLKSVSSIKPLS